MGSRSVGDIEEIKELRARGDDSWNAQVCRIAARNGHLECLKYLYENGCPFGKSVCVSAASNGHLDCLKYLHEQGCYLHVETTAYAARNGHLECLKYAHESGFPWDENTTAFAARKGHLECLKYAHEHGCPWTSRASIYAAEYGHIECFKYCFKHWTSTSTPFWSIKFYLPKCIEKFDFDDPVWKQLLTHDFDLTQNPRLYSKVEAKKKELQDLVRLQYIV